MKLTPEQQATTNRIIDDYVQIGLSITPINRDAATEATLSLYDALESKRPTVILHVQSPFASAIGGLLLDRVFDKRHCLLNDGAVLHALDEVKEELAGQISSMDAGALGAILQDMTSQIQSQMPAIEQAFWSMSSIDLSWTLLHMYANLGSEEVMVSWKKKAPTLKEVILQRLARDRGRTTDWLSKRRIAAPVTDTVQSARVGIDDAVASSIRLHLHSRSLGKGRDFCESDTLAMLAEARWLTSKAINLGVMNGPKLFHAIERMVSQAGHVSTISVWCGIAISDRPAELHLDARQRPHRLDGPAILYRDGWAIYAIHGIAVPREVIEQPSSITVRHIDEEKNVEVRRVLIERYGLDRYMKDSQAELLHRDATGLLYRKQVTGDEPITMVRVLNSTPEAEGTLSRDEALVAFGEAAQAALRAPADARFKEYMIRVPPDMTKAHEAVAWTFGLAAEDYHPALET